MTWKAKIAELFAEPDTSESFTEAKTQLSRLKNQITNVNVVINDNHSNLVFIKNKWQVLPNDMGENVRFVALQTGEDYNLVLCDMAKNGSIYNHKHTKNYEVARVIDGVVKLIHNNEETFLYPGDEVKFKYGENHSLECLDESRVLMAYSTTKKNAVIYNESILLAEKFEKKS